MTKVINQIVDQVSSRSANGDPSPQNTDTAPAPDAIRALTELARRKWLIAKVTGSTLLIGVLMCFLLPNRYMATIRIMPPKQTPSTTALLSSQAGLASLADSSGAGLLKDPNAIYIGLLKSRPIADAMIASFGLEKVYRSRDMTGARKTLERNTTVTSEKSTLVAISVTDADGNRAAGLANAYAEQLRILTRNISMTEASRRRLFFEEQLKSEKESLIAAEAALQKVQQDHGLVHLDAQANVIIGRLAGIRAEISAKEVELQAQRSYSTERNPDVQLAERELSALQGEAATIENRKSGTGEFSESGLKDVPQAGLDYLRAERELQYQQAFFDLLIKQYEAARLDEAKEAATIQVVEPAIVPERRSSPRALIILPISLLVGFALSYQLIRCLRWLEAEKSDPERARALQEFKYALVGRNT